MKNLLLISLLLLISSCATKLSTVDVTNQNQKNLGNVIVSSPLILCSTEKLNHFAPKNVKFALQKAYSNHCFYENKLVLKIKKGDALFLQKVVKHSALALFHFESLYVLGEYKHKNLTYKFYYDLSKFQRSDATLQELFQSKDIPWN
ncbi:MAG: hypothetical protein ACRBEE_00835 [Arenicella sp.]